MAVSDWIANELTLESFEVGICTPNIFILPTLQNAISLTFAIFSSHFLCFLSSTYPFFKTLYSIIFSAMLFQQVCCQQSPTHAGSSLIPCPQNWNFCQEQHFWENDSKRTLCGKGSYCWRYQPRGTDVQASLEAAWLWIAEHWRKGPLCGSPCPDFRGHEFSFHSIAFLLQ